MNIKEILIKKAEYPVRLIATEDSKVEDWVFWLKGNELVIEAIDFSAGTLRLCNKSVNENNHSFPTIIETRYNKDTGELIDNFEFKPKKRN